jgi:hypothetical protein
VWLEDRPFTRELEYELNPVTNEEFVSLLVGQNVVNGVDVVTIYGGVDWGYYYTANDTPVPEPASFGLVATGIGVIAMLAHRSRRRKGASGGRDVERAFHAFDYHPALPSPSFQKG